MSRVETVSGAGVERTIHPVAVFDTVGIEVENGHGIDIAHAEFRRERNLGEWTLGTFFKKDEDAAGGVGRVDRKVNSPGNQACTEGKRMTVTQTKYTVVVRRVVLADFGHEFSK